MADPRCGARPDIDFCEFAALMAHKMHEESKEDAIIAAFKVFDQSGDGRIDPHEFCAGFGTKRQRSMPMNSLSISLVSFLTR